MNTPTRSSSLPKPKPHTDPICVASVETLPPYSLLPYLQPSIEEKRKHAKIFFDQLERERLSGLDQKMDQAFNKYGW